MATPLEIGRGAALSSLASAESKSSLAVPAGVREYARWERIEAQPSMAKAVSAAKAFIARQGRAPGLFLTGPTGTFKTTLGWTILRGLRERYLGIYGAAVDEFIGEANPARSWYSEKARLPEWRVRFITGSDLYLRALPTGDDHDRVHLINDLTAFRSASDFNVLFWDDIEKFKPGEYIGSIILAILDARYRHGLPIIVTSNRTPAELVPLLGEVAVRRLGDMCEYVELPLPSSAAESAGNQPIISGRPGSPLGSGLEQRSPR